MYTSIIYIHVPWHIAKATVARCRGIDVERGSVLIVVYGELFTIMHGTDLRLHLINILWCESVRVCVFCVRKCVRIRVAEHVLAGTASIWIHTYIQPGLWHQTSQLVAVNLGDACHVVGQQ